jgi:hypothetical protein
MGRISNFLRAFRRPTLLVLETTGDDVRWGEVKKTRFPDGPDYKYHFETVYDILWEDGSSETLPTHYFQWVDGIWTRYKYAHKS